MVNRYQHTRDMCVGLAALLVALFFLAATPFQVSPRSDDYGISGRTLPVLVAGALLGLGLYLLIRNLIRIRRATPRMEAPEKKADRRRRFGRAMLYMASIAVYIAGFSYVDYLLSSMLMVAFGMWLSGFRNRISFACIVAIMPALIYYVFSVVMEIPLPESVFGI